MKDIEKLLEEDKMQQIPVPEALEQRLTNKLMNYEKPKKKNYLWMSSIAVAALLFLFVSVNFNGVAYYSKLLVGYEELLSQYENAALEEQNGQIVNKSVTIDDTVITIEKIITDANKSIILLKIKGNEDFTQDNAFNWLSIVNLDGFLTNNYMQSAISEWKEEEKTLYSAMTFGSINGFAKELKLNLTNTLLEIPKEVNITFDYNANKALETVFKEKINQKLKLADGYIKLSEITSSSISTYLEGEMKLPKEIQLGTQRIDFSDIQIIVNGMVLESTGGGISNQTGKNKFTIQAEGIVDKIDSLVIAIPTFVNYKQLDLTIPSKTNEIKEGITIESIRQDEANTYVTLSTTNDVLLDGVSVISTNNVRTSLVKTIETKEKGTIKTRTLVFPTTDDIQSIDIEGKFYKEKYNYEVKIK